MDAIEAVLDLAKERDELAETVSTYETALEGLVGKTVLLSFGKKNHKRFVECEVTEFLGEDGWEATGVEDQEVYVFTIEDLVSGKVQI
jgi:hypothetical protein